MSDSNQSTQQPEPQDPGTQEVQEPSTTVLDVASTENRPGIQGYPLSDIFRGLGAAFRSSALQSMAVGWTAQISQEYEQLKQDHKQVRDKLEAERIRVARLEERTDADKRVHVLTDFLKVIGGVVAGSAVNFYKENTIFLVILLVFGIALIGAGFLLGKPRA